MALATCTASRNELEQPSKSHWLYPGTRLETTQKTVNQLHRVDRHAIRSQLTQQLPWMALLCVEYTLLRRTAPKPVCGSVARLFPSVSCHSSNPARRDLCRCSTWSPRSSTGVGFTLCAHAQRRAVGLSGSRRSHSRHTKSKRVVYTVLPLGGRNCVHRATSSPKSAHSTARCPIVGSGTFENIQSTWSHLDR